MRVMVLPADMAGCGSYRLIWVSEYLQSQGYDVTIQYPKDPKTGMEVHFRGDVVGDPNAEIIDVRLDQEADVLVMQRLSHTWHSRAVQVLRQKGMAVVIDMDDDLSCIHRDNKAYWTYHPRNTRTPFSWKNVEQACKDATMVTVSTKELLKVYARHGRGHVLDNYIPARVLNISVDQEKVFGWAGTTDSHPNDCQVTGNAVQQLIDDGYDFKIVGPASRSQQVFRLKEEPRNTGTLSPVNWTTEVARLQVAMAPLATTAFNTSKSRLKVLEASSVGVPWVASPRAEYRRFHQECGGGILADNPKDWYKNVKQLMDDSGLRKELAERGRTFCQSQTIEGNAWRTWEAWERALKIQRGVTT